uniref:Putative zinc finger and btb domain-containing protein 48 n=1 Tax=Rhipicephalus pulchellus TaxID=72859 RepID=L7LV11_RHIPC
MLPKQGPRADCSSTGTRNNRRVLRYHSHSTGQQKNRYVLGTLPTVIEIPHILIALINKTSVCNGTIRWRHGPDRHVGYLSAREAEHVPPTDSSGSNMRLPENVDTGLHRCSYCNRFFRARSNLTAHLRIHAGERPYKCHLCHHGFTQRTNLVHHLRTHTGERPFQCRFCPRTFARKLPCKYHEIRRHLKGNSVV